MLPVFNGEIGTKDVNFWTLNAIQIKLHSLDWFLKDVTYIISYIFIEKYLTLRLCISKLNFSIKNSTNFGFIIVV